MKKYLITSLLIFSCIASYSQSISLLAMMNLTGFKSQQVEEYFQENKAFKLQFGEEVDGFIVKHYQTDFKLNKQETVLTGMGFVATGGATLYTISYVTNEAQNIINIINQTKGVGLKLSFQGVDDRNNIYIYDNYQYHVVIKLNLNQSSGTVDVSEKQAAIQ